MATTTTRAVHRNPADQDVGSTASVRSADGTTIGYRRFGHGPTLVVLHGAMSSGYNHLEFARLLADRWTVVVPDRRGRGLSGPACAVDGLATELQDLSAVLDATGAEAFFGVSSGAIVGLHVAAGRPSLRKVAIYEPPLFVDDRRPRQLLARLDRELADGDIAGALVTGMLGAEMGPPFMRRVPRPLIRLLIRFGIAGENRSPADGYVPMRLLAPTLRQDFAVVAEASGQQGALAAIAGEVLLFGGSRSPAYLGSAMDSLATVIPHARRLQLDGLDHAASWNTDRGGNPVPVAEAVRTFLESST